MNCKPGDLAIIINVHEEDYLDWIGRIVECGKKYQHKEFWVFDIQWVGSKPASCKGRTQAIWEKWLRPISGLPMEEETELKLKEPA